MGNRPAPPPDHYITQAITDPNYSTISYSFALSQIKLLKSNVCYILEVEQMPTLTFFKLLNAAGCKITRDAWVKGKRETIYNSFVIFTMAYVLKTDYNTLFSEDIVRDYVGKSQQVQK